MILQVVAFSSCYLLKNAVNASKGLKKIHADWSDEKETKEQHDIRLPMAVGLVDGNTSKIDLIIGISKRKR